MLAFEKNDGFIELGDGSKLKLKMLILDVKETGFSPFGGVYFYVNPIAGIATVYVPEGLKESMRDKPVVDLTKIPQEGWSMIDIKSSKNAVQEVEVPSSKGRFRIKVETEPLMVARNMSFKVSAGIDEPLYWAYWVYKVSWRPVEGDKR